jgi:fructokinase
VGPEGAPLLYHGTLALRGDRSWNALERVLEATGAPTFVDLNLRAPWWTRDRLRWCLTSATWLKLSQEELATVSGADVHDLDDTDACVRSARGVATTHDIRTMLVTRGAAGSLVIAGERELVCRGGMLGPGEIVDTVGAGDGFSAVACVGVLEGWSAEEILRRGNAFAADLCRIRGAISEDRALYERHRGLWGTGS